jgi:hypothetical protein
VVVDDGETETEPFVATLPTPLLMDALAAFELDQLRVEDEP